MKIWCIIYVCRQSSPAYDKFFSSQEAYNEPFIRFKVLRDCTGRVLDNEQCKQTRETSENICWKSQLKIDHVNSFKVSFLLRCSPILLKKKLIENSHSCFALSPKIHFFVFKQENWLLVENLLDCEYETEKQIFFYIFTLNLTNYKCNILQVLLYVSPLLWPLFYRRSDDVYHDIITAAILPLKWVSSNEIKSFDHPLVIKYFI